MKNLRKRIFKLSVLLLILTITFLFIGCPRKPKTLKLTILYLNDTHAYYAPHKVENVGDKIGGFARVMTIIRNVRKENSVNDRETLVLHAGDLYSGTLYSTLFRGMMGIRLMNKLKVDAMAIGNHEFDYGKRQFDNLILYSEFEILSNNIVDENGDLAYRGYVVKKFPRNSTKVVIFGLTTPSTKYTTHPNNVKEFTFVDPIKSANDLLSKFSEEDLIIALTHLGIEDDKKLAANCPKIDVIIGGHSHTRIDQPLKVNKTLICQAGAYCEYLGHLDVEVDNGEIINYQGELYHLDEKYEEANDVKKMIGNWDSRINKRFKIDIAKSEVFWDGEKESVRSKETNLGKLISKIMIVNTGADLAIMNGGGIRASIPPGPITVKMVYNVIPFDNTIYTIKLKGEYIQNLLQRSNDLKDGDGGKLHTWGVAYKVKDGKVVIERINNSKFDPEKVYTVALSDFIMDGGDGYTIFKEKGTDPLDTKQVLRDTVLYFFRGKKIITEKLIKINY